MIIGSSFITFMSLSFCVKLFSKCNLQWIFSDAILHLQIELKIHDFTFLNVYMSNRADIYVAIEQLYAYNWTNSRSLIKNI